MFAVSVPMIPGEVSKVSNLTPINASIMLLYHRSNADIISHASDAQLSNPYNIAIYQSNKQQQLVYWWISNY